MDLTFVSFSFFVAIVYSIYNHMLEFIRRLFGRPRRSRHEDYRLSRPRRETPSVVSMLYICIYTRILSFDAQYVNVVEKINFH